MCLSCWDLMQKLSSNICHATVVMRNDYALGLAVGGNKLTQPAAKRMHHLMLRLV